LRILLVEDDRSLSMAVVYKLKKAGMEVTAVSNGSDGYDEANGARYDLVILDRMLPGMEGAVIVTKLRQKGITTPVLMLTAMDTITDRVEGLNAGADDYLIKPFAMDELIARINALMRRPEKWLPSGSSAVYDLKLQTETMLLTGPSSQSILSGRECRLMAFLINNAPRILPRSLIMDRVWGAEAVEEGNLDIHIHYLRKKMKIKSYRFI